MEDTAYLASLKAIPDPPFFADQDALDAKIEVIMYAMDCGIGCMLAITDAACIATELGYKNFIELGQHYSATAVIRDGQLHLTPIA